MNINKQLLSMAIICLSLTACSASEPVQLPTPKLQHALLKEPQSELIAQGIARLMRSDNIAVTDDVFMKRSPMVVDSFNKTDTTGNSIMGKQLNMPDRFELLIKNSLCFVRHLDSKATEPLPEVKCKPND